MKRTIGVFLGDSAHRVGSLRYDRDGAREHAAFEYDPHWLAAPDRFAIDPALPLVPGPQFRHRLGPHSTFHSAIADTEPDGWGRRVILRDHARRRAKTPRPGIAGQSDPLGDLDFLLSADDASRVGALRFRDEEGVFRRAPEPDARTTPPLIELRHLIAATRAVEMNAETAADLAYLLGRGTSLGGLRPKCSVLDEDGSLAIGKFPSVDDTRSVTKGEVLALRLARDAGIDAASARLVLSDATPVALIRRFDREPGGRIPYMSAATMLQANSGDPADHTYAEVIDALRVRGADPKHDAEELWRRIAFSILITNTDDHLHNHGFLHAARDTWRLAPAFDVNPFPDRARELKTWISEDAGPRATVDALMSASAYFQLTPAKARAVLRDVENAVAKWRVRGTALGMTSAELDAFHDAFEHEERGKARIAARSRSKVGRTP